ncbi:acyltransferase family protein [Tunturiibacter gelidoferens]|uniref:Acyltransferase n=2 Tax=Tunturiibacter gelidiferens TaxID=3069689 RepID=A0AAU7Z1Z0_9BACT|nr:acyltransferase [Edaphobacter lichenicola]MBB5341285.1 peptidoglycan/LPS O-acetylase OafA/YrhL [Edaphobacter lichenicola]
MKLRRITTHGNWIPEIDGLRFVAIAATLFVHILAEMVNRSGQTFSAFAQRNVPELVDRGGRGVLLFFAISGFILAQPFLRQHLLHGQPVSIKAFFKRRLTRLEPPYILCLVLYALVLAIYEHHLFPLLLPLMAHIFYLHNFTSLPPINFVTWSLEVEVQFYILAPVLGLLYAISSTIVRRSAIVSLIAASTAFQYLTHGTASWNLPGQLQFFLVGFLLADLRATRTESTTSRWWDLVSVVVWVAIFALPTSYTSLCLPLLILLAYLATFNGPVSRQIFRTPWIALTGGMCYSFYLMHMMVISIAFRLTRRLLIPSSLPLSFLIQSILLGTCIYLFCTAYFILIERPCMDPKWPHKLASKLSNLSRPRRAVVVETSVENR